MIEVDTGKKVFSGAWSPGFRDETALLQRVLFVVQKVDRVIEDFSWESWIRHCRFRPEEGSIFGAGFKTPASPPSQLFLRSIKGVFSTVLPILWSPANREPEGYLTRYVPVCPVIFAWLDLGYAVLMMSSARLNPNKGTRLLAAATGRPKSSSVPITSFTGDPSFPCPQGLTNYRIVSGAKSTPCPTLMKDPKGSILRKTVAELCLVTSSVPQ